MKSKCSICQVETQPSGKGHGWWCRCQEHTRCDDCGAKPEDTNLCLYHPEQLLCDPCRKKRMDAKIAEVAADRSFSSVDQLDIFCPYCGYRFEDSWEYSNEYCDDSVMCGECERMFGLTVVTERTYTTTKRK